MKYNINFFILIEIIYYLLFNFSYNNKLKKTLVFIATIFFAIYLGARDSNIGADTQTYINEYLKGNGGYFKEIGFRAIGVFLYKLGFNFQYYLIFLSIFNTILFYIGFNLLKKNNYLIFWIFLFNVTYLYGITNIVRQSIASSFILIGIAVLKQKKFLFFYFFVFIAFLFHQTAIFFILLPYFFKYYKKINNKKKYLILVIFYFLPLICLNVLMLFPKFNNYFSSTANMIFIKILISLIFYIMYSNLKNKDIFIEYIIFYQICIVIFFIDFKLFSSRFLYYLNCYFPFILVDIFFNKLKNKKIFLGGVLLYHIYILFYSSTIEIFKWTNIY